MPTHILPAASRRLRFALAAALAVAFVLLAAVARPGAAHAAGYMFVPERLTAYDIQDGWPDVYDEPHAYYGTKSWAGTIRQGSSAKPLLPSEPFTGSQLQFDLWERDNGWYDTDHLGTATITSAFPNEERSLTIKDPGGLFHPSYNYELVYKVVPN